jgi:hypothetical protein
VSTRATVLPLYSLGMLADMTSRCTFADLSTDASQVVDGVDWTRAFNLLRGLVRVDITTMRKRISTSGFAGSKHAFQCVLNKALQNAVGTCKRRKVGG